MHEIHQCRDLLGSLGDFLDGEAAEELCAAIEKHMRECENCRILVDTLHKTIELYRVHTPSPAKMPAQVRLRLYRRLNLEPYLKPPAG